MKTRRRIFSLCAVLALALVPTAWAASQAENEQARDYFTDVVTPLERVDYAAALYANARATARAGDALCARDTAQWAGEIAGRVQAAVESMMWDEASRFYYSLRETDDAKAWVKEIVGFYPFAFELAPAEHEDALGLLFDPDEFWTEEGRTRVTWFTPLTCSRNGTRRMRSGSSASTQRLPQLRRPARCGGPRRPGRLAIRTHMKWGSEYAERHDLSSLRLLGSVGEPISPEAWV